MTDVAHQPHYEKFKIQPIDYMRSILTKEQFAGYCRGNVLKYVSRYKEKGGVEDLEKAQLYLKWLIETEEASGPSGCLLHKVGKECPLVGPDRHCGKKRCRIDSVNPFREEVKK